LFITEYNKEASAAFNIRIIGFELVSLSVRTAIYDSEGLNFIPSTLTGLYVLSVPCVITFCHKKVFVKASRYSKMTPSLAAPHTPLSKHFPPMMIFCVELISIAV
jgi:hypothetical protein